MSSRVAPKRGKAAVDTTVANGTKIPGSEGSTHRFQEGLGNHPLWQEYMAELEASRQADIAEANRLADLELEELEK